jgi:predicted Rossmann fold nucleotide-binding protein DprA/Smf involved in DNA uptake
VIVSGGARGVDQAAAGEARRLGLPVIEYLPDWAAYGRAAGMIRNRLIVGNADAVIAFWDGQSRGTRASIELARKIGVPVYLFRGRVKR